MNKTGKVFVAALAGSAVLVGGLTACGSSGHTASTPAASHLATAPSSQGSSGQPVPAASTAGRAPVPGSHDTTYVVGPFTVEQVGFGRLPRRFDVTDANGNDIPKYGETITVKNTSGSFTGWISVQVEFVMGHYMDGQVLETDQADPTAGRSGGITDSLSPGQSETVYAAYQGTRDPSYRGYVSGHMFFVDYRLPNGNHQSAFLSFNVHDYSG